MGAHTKAVNRQGSGKEEESTWVNHSRCRPGRRCGTRDGIVLAAPGRRRAGRLCVESRARGDAGRRRRFEFKAASTLFHPASEQEACPGTYPSSGCCDDGTAYRRTAPRGRDVHGARLDGRVGMYGWGGGGGGGGGGGAREPQRGSTSSNVCSAATRLRFRASARRSAGSQASRLTGHRLAGVR